jgi:hypothetical protein
MLRLSPTTLEKVLKMGASVQRFVRGAPAAAGESVEPVDESLPLGPPPF